MLTLPRYLHALEQFHTARTPQELTQILSGLGQSLGFHGIVHGMQSYSRQSGLHVDSTSVISDRWHSHYMQQAYYQIDPRVHHCARRTTPLLWSSAEPCEHPRAAQMMREAHDFGLRAGIYAPVHSMDGRFSLTCVSLRDVPQAEALDLVRHAAPLLPALAAHAHEAALRLLPGGQQPEAALTRRERECLQWAAAGKTSWEIGLVLNIAERTVNFHLGNAMAKLGCHSRQHAIAKALMQGLVRL
ncbi:helix-turn-helix transcriptional regulator [Ottowia sp.]|uniref:helix-turn-helix transcriptional regulator n=1 Tax=Ottowia sp. TaxID=1898956 RepID=UPI0039E5E76D